MSESESISEMIPINRKEKRLSRIRKADSFRPSGSFADSVMFLQRTIGNQAVERIIRSGTLQTKLSIGHHGDKYEQEADRVADAVMRMPVPEIVSGNGLHIRRSCPVCEENELKRQPITEEDEEKLKRQPIKEEDDEEKKLHMQPEEEEEEKLQAKKSSNSVPEIYPNIESHIQSLNGEGQPLPEDSRAFFEPRFGSDFSQVRVHTDGKAAETAQSLNAAAFTIGKNVVFAQGRYAPETSSGKTLLAHELTHVIQQNKNHQIPLQRLVTPNRVSCRNYPRTYPIFTIMRTNDPVSEVQTADARAIEILNNIVNELTNIRIRVIGGEVPGWPLIGDAVGLGLRNRLRLDANNRAIWTGTGPRTVEIIIRWYNNILSLLRSGRISYSCIGSICGAGDWAYVFPGSRRINLCRNFWNATEDNRALTLIHETAHLYYGLEDAGGGAGNASCLEQYAADANGISILPEFITICRPP